MAFQFLQRLTGRDRTRTANRQLGGVLAFVAGAVNAGGFLAVARYTSHMSGIISGIADDLALGSIGLALAGLVALGAFVSGAACTSLLINWGRHRQLQGKYALALLLEAGLLLLFGLLGANLHDFKALLVPTTVLLLCFIMGLQNAIITKISNAEIRTTHMTGVVTDLGIELGKMLYWNRSGRPPEQQVRANHQRLRLFAGLLGMFLVGGIAGAAGFKYVGFVFVVPLALVLFALALPPLWIDRARLRMPGQRTAGHTQPPASPPPR